MKDVNIKSLDNIDIPDDKLPMYIGEEGITIDNVFYKNVKKFLYGFTVNTSVSKPIHFETEVL